ncbi:MAG: hypothetical protein ACI8ZB_001031 [Desulforhopalus sp.]|jgi:hypothetical protein
MKLYYPHKNEGFILVVCMVMLVLLTLMGIVGTRTTTTELLISGNDKVSKQVFYNADGDTEVGIELVELNVSCPTGFMAAPGGFDNTSPLSASAFPIYGVDVFDSTFALDEVATDVPNTIGAGITLANYPSVDARTIRIAGDPANPDVAPTTNMAIFGKTEYSAGAAIQLAAGYDGKGKGAAGGGAVIKYEIHAQHRGLANSESIVRLDWLHLIGTESVCTY